MEKIKFNINLMKFLSVFEGFTKVSPKDCIETDDNRLIFIIKEGDMWKALGKNASNLHDLEKALNRKIKIVEFNPELLGFIRNLIYPFEAADITNNEGVVTIKGSDTKTKGLLIGRNAQNLRRYESIARRYFPIKEIKVV